MKGLGIAFRDQMGGALGPVQHELDRTHGILRTWQRKQHTADGGHAAITTTELVNSGLTSFGGPWEVPEGSVLTPPQITANTDNYQPIGIDTAIVLRLSTDASRNLTGIYQYGTGVCRWLFLINVGNQNIVLVHASTSSALYQLACPGSANLTLNSGDSCWAFYDANSGNWRVSGV